MSRFCRDDWIRTSDPLHPMQVRYRAALRPEFPERGANLKKKYYPLNDNPTLFNASRSLGIDPGPIPWNFNISASEKVESSFKVLISLFSSARLAGAAISVRK